jgi:hypothetical protein
MIKTIGHNSTPTVMLKESVLPKTSQAIGVIPSVRSTEKIFTPINSAIIALAIKNDPSIKKRIVLLFSFIPQI